MEQQARRAFANIVRKTDAPERHRRARGRGPRSLDGMCRAAAEITAEQVTRDDLEAGSFYSSIRDLRHVSVRIAGAVVREARESGVGCDLPDQSFVDAVAAMRWDPNY